MTSFDYLYGSSGFLQAAADLSANQHFAVKLDASGQVTLAGAGDRIVGILRNKPVQGEACSIAEAGYYPAVLGATVTAGQDLAVDAAGKLVPATTGDAIVAQAVQGGAADEIVTVRIQPAAATAP